MKISVICPAFNGAPHLDQLMDFFVNALPADKELLYVDGMSKDGSREMVQEWSKKHPNIHLIDNPKKYVPFGLNKAIRQAKGEYIARLDAHTEYPNDYFEKCLRILQKSGADNVGGYIVSKGKTTVGKAIAVAMSSQFGVGNSEFRTELTDRFVDTVPFGFWKREAFDKFGLFDEELMRNQDDEFNYRTNKLGGKIFLSSEIKSEYYVRDSYKAMFKQYYEYGVYKPLVFKKLGNEGVRIRHIVPIGFSLYLMTSVAACWFWWWSLPFLLYLLLNIIFSFKSTESLLVKLFTIPAYTLLHLAYGLGFGVGMWRWRKRKILQ